MKYAGVVIALGFSAFSCEDPKPPQKPELTTEQVKIISEEMNVWDADRQRDEIEQYIARRGWKMNTTPSGMYYMVMQPASGDSARIGQTAKVKYDIYLLDGTRCYSSDTTGPKDFVIGEDYVESGLHEGIQLMHVGEQMRFILPSHLAHGLTGDQDKIPPRSSVIYEVKLLELR